MNKQKIGLIFFWLGVFLSFIWVALTVIQGPVQRAHTAQELSGTVHAIWGTLFTIRIIGGSGVAFSLVGVLLSSGKKGSYFWLLGLLPSLANFGMYWKPSQHVPLLFGIGGTVILISYLGVLWVWARTYAAYEGAARTGRKIQLLGYSFLVAASQLLCMYFGNPKVLALADLPIPSGQSINLTLGIGMLFLFVGYYWEARKIKETTANPQEAHSPQPAATD